MKSYLILILLVLIIFTPVFYFLCILHSNLTDFELHIIVAKKIINEGYLKIPPHFLFHLLIIVFFKLFHLSIINSSLIIVLLSQCATALIIFYILKDNLKLLSDSVLLFFTISIMLLHIIPVLAIIDNQIFQGYIGINTYINSTILLLKPFAILVLYFSVRVFNNSNKTVKTYFLALLFTILSIISKPNFILCLLPALSLVSIFYYLKKVNIDFKFLILSIIIPSIILLAFQFYWTYTNSISLIERSGIGFSPFTVMSHYSNYLALKLFLSILFPLSVLVFFNKEIKFDRILILTWGCFLVSLFYTYFIIETGTRMYHGNFVWGSQICNFLLHIFSLIFFLRKVEFQKTMNIKKSISEYKISIPAIVYTLNFISGLGYYISRFYLA